MQPYQHYKQAGFPGIGAAGALASRALRSYFEDANSDGLQGLRALIGTGAGGLIGAGLGAGGGLLREAFSAKPENAQYLRRALQGMSLGGLVGAGLGAGIGASNMGKGIQTALEESAAKAHVKTLEAIVNSINSVKVTNLPLFVEQPIFQVNPDLLKSD